MTMPADSKKLCLLLQIMLILLSTFSCSKDKPTESGTQDEEQVTYIVWSGNVVVTDASTGRGISGCSIKLLTVSTAQAPPFRTVVTTTQTTNSEGKATFSVQNFGDGGILVKGIEIRDGQGNLIYKQYEAIEDYSTLGNIDNNSKAFNLQVSVSSVPVLKADDLIGSWTVKNATTGDIVTWTFRSDGTTEITSSGGGGDSRGTWRVSNGLLITDVVDSAGRHVNEWAAYVDGDKLYIRLSTASVEPVPFQRVESNPTPQIPTVSQEVELANTLTSQYKQKLASSTASEARRFILDYIKKLPNVSQAGLSGDGSSIWWTYDGGGETVLLTETKIANSTTSGKSASVSKPVVFLQSGNRVPIQNRKALLLSPFSWDWRNPGDETTYIGTLLSTAGFQVTLKINSTKDQQNISMSEYESFDNYGLITINTHGGLAKDDIVFIVTGARVTEGSPYLIDWIDGYLVKTMYVNKLLSKNDVLCWGIKPAFVKKHYPNGLSNTLCYVSACDGLYNDTMADAILGSYISSSVYLGWTKTVTAFTASPACSNFFDFLVNGKTIGEAYEEVKAKGLAGELSSYLQVRGTKEAVILPTPGSEPAMSITKLAIIGKDITAKSRTETVSVDYEISYSLINPQTDPETGATGVILGILEGYKAIFNSELRITDWDWWGMNQTGYLYCTSSSGTLKGTITSKGENAWLCSKVRLSIQYAPAGFKGPKALQAYSNEIKINSTVSQE